MTKAKEKVRNWRFDLLRHDDGGASAGGSVGAVGTPGGDGMSASGVDAVAAGQSAPGQEDSRLAHGDSFDDLIKKNPEYKAAMDAKIQAAINGRFKRANAVEERAKKTEALLAKMGSKYGIAPGEDGLYDVDALGKAADDDDSYYEAEALERGLSVADLKHIKSIEAENAAFRRAEEDAKKRAGEQQFYARLAQGEAETKALYPGFDLDTEMQNETFQRLVLGAGVPVKTAYEVCHMSEVIPSAMQFAASKTAEQTARNIVAGKSRPVENSAVSSTPVSTRLDPRNLTPEQRAEIRARVRRGEDVTFD